MSICKFNRDKETKEHTFIGELVQCAICEKWGCQKCLLWQSDPPVCQLCVDKSEEELAKPTLPKVDICTKTESGDATHGTCLLDNKKRICQYNIKYLTDAPHTTYKHDQKWEWVGKEWKLLPTTHVYSGPAYLCEDCNEWGCRDCLHDDAWGERCRDGVFLCYRCYNDNRNWMDMM